MNIDRKTPPAFQEIEAVKVLEANQLKLKNGLELAYINAGSEKVIKLEVFFDAGSANAGKTVVAHAVNQLLDKGTINRTAIEIATSLDNLGAYISKELSFDNSNISLYCLSHQLSEALPILIEIITQASFPEKEFKTYLNNHKQKLSVNLERVSFIAKQQFPSIIFGANHPYASYIKMEDFEDLDIEEIRKFYQKNVLNNSMRLQLSGDVNKELLDDVIHSFEQLELETAAVDNFPTLISADKAQKVFIEKEKAVQSAIRIGKPLFNRLHPDYIKMQMVSTILGGYFGSRLMTNIREDKGYTYGIGSVVLPLKNAGYFFITTEVGAEVCSAALSEIYMEIKRLQEESVSDHELKLVKNYVLGSFLKSVDGPFAQMDKYQIIKESSLEYSYFVNYVREVKSLSAVDIKKLSNQYLQIDSLSELIVGKR